MTSSVIPLKSSKSSSFFPQPGTTTSNNSRGRSNANSKSKTAKKKKKRKRGSTATKQKMLNRQVYASTGKAMSDDQLVEHVASKYTTGPRGPLDERMRNLQSPQESEHSAYLKRLSNCPALVLNADYKVRYHFEDLLPCPDCKEMRVHEIHYIKPISLDETIYFVPVFPQPLSYLPLSLWTWQDAIKSVLSGKATVVETYPEKKIRAANLEIPLPCVISLNEYVPAGNTRPAFTRRNVFLRDEYTCQYCTNRFHTSDLSLDHVHPRCMGGVLSWYVSSCRAVLIYFVVILCLFLFVLIMWFNTLTGSSHIPQSYQFFILYTGKIL